jgi:hypothetical protein
MEENGQNRVEVPNKFDGIEIKSREKGDPLAQVCWHGPGGELLVSREEAEELTRRAHLRADALKKQQKEKWLASAGGQLCMKFWNAFREYEDFLQENPQARHMARGWNNEYYDEHKLFEEGLKVMATYADERAETRRKSLEKAKKSARCQHLHVSGEQCGSPKMRGRKLCYMHERMEEARNATLDLGPMEDADSIQMGIRKLQSTIIEGKLGPRQVGQLAYTIQLAAWNVTRTKRLIADQRGPKKQPTAD